MPFHFKPVIHAMVLGLGTFIGVTGTASATPFSLDWSSEFTTLPTTATAPLSDTETLFVLNTLNGDDFNVADFSGQVGVGHSTANQFTSLRQSTGDPFSLSGLSFGSVGSSPFTLNCFATDLDGVSHDCSVGVPPAAFGSQTFNILIPSRIGGNRPLTELIFDTRTFNDVFLISAAGDDDPCGTNPSLQGCPVATNNGGGTVPEPGTFGLLGIGMAGLIFARRRRPNSGSLADPNPSA